MSARKLHQTAWIALALHGLYHAAEALCSIFVGVYFWINSLSFFVVCMHYLALYAVTPVFFLLAGWYAQRYDRLHVYRLGLLLNICYYGTLLLLQERSVDYAVPLGALLGVTWGVFYAGANTFDFDVTKPGAREYYFGLLQSVTGTFRLLAPIVGSAVIFVAPDRLLGYHLVFFIAILLYAACFVISFKMPKDNVRRPFRIRRALFPGKDQRDWRLILLASASMAGSFTILAFLLGLIMFMQTGNELSVGGFASFQAITGIVTAYTVGRFVRPHSRKPFMLAGVIVLVGAGIVVAWELSVITLVVFGFMRSVAGPLFGIPHFSLRLDTINRCASDPSERIEYLCAWEAPLALGRVFMMALMMLLFAWFIENDLGLRLTLFTLCAVRILTYFILIRTDALRGALPEE